MLKIIKRVLRNVLPDKIFRAAKKVADDSRRKANQGKGVECPICGSEYKVFETFRSRLNARCPNCESLERHRLIWKYLAEKTDFNNRPKFKLLHFAPEKAFFKRIFDKPNVDYYPVDLFPEEYAYFPAIKVQKVDITSIPFPEGSFDVIFCNHVLEHIPDDRLAMRELRRVLKKDGWALITVPQQLERTTTYEDFSITDPEGRRKAFGQSTHVRWYGQDFKDRLVEAGFNVKENAYAMTFSKEEIFKYGFSAGHVIYYCTRTA